MLEKILKLGHPKLYERSVEVNRKELAHLNNDINLLHDLILECQRVHGFGRGIAAPQIGVMKRIVCLNLKGEQYTLINPQLSQMSEKMMELWDDCMSFPGLHVRLQRHRSCRLSFYDCQWEKHFWRHSVLLMIGHSGGSDIRSMWYSTVDIPRYYLQMYSKLGLIVQPSFNRKGVDVSTKTYLPLTN